MQLPNNASMHSKECGQLLLSNLLSQHAKTAHIFDELKSASLISLGKLCDDSCKIHLDKHHIQIFKDNEQILKGFRNPKDGLWDIPLINKNNPLRNLSIKNTINPYPTHHANVILSSNLLSYIFGVS